MRLLPLAPSTTRGPNVHDSPHKFPEQRLGTFGTVKVRGELDIILMSVTLNTEGKMQDLREEGYIWFVTIVT